MRIPVGPVIAVILLLCLAGVVFASGASPEMPSEATQKPQDATFGQGVIVDMGNTVTALPSPFFTPTPQATLVAVMTENAVQRAYWENQQAELNYKIAADMATWTAQVPAWTQTAVYHADARATANAESTRVNAIVATATQQYLFVMALTPTAQAIQTAQVRANVMTGVLVVIAAVVMVIVGWLARIFGERLKMDNDQRRAEMINLSNVPYTPAPTIAPEWTEGKGGARFRKPNIKITSEARVAAYVLEHGWNDDMRNGEGVGMDYELFTQYRDYLENIGVIAQKGRGYEVLNPEYFSQRLSPTK